MTEDFGAQAFDQTIKNKKTSLERRIEKWREDIKGEFEFFDIDKFEENCDAILEAIENPRVDEERIKKMEGEFDNHIDKMREYFVDSTLFDDWVKTRKDEANSIFSFSRNEWVEVSSALDRINESVDELNEIYMYESLEDIMTIPVGLAKRIVEFEELLKQFKKIKLDYEDLENRVISAFLAHQAKADAQNSGKSPQLCLLKLAKLFRTDKSKVKGKPLSNHFIASVSRSQMSDYPSDYHSLSVKENIEEIGRDLKELLVGNQQSVSDAQLGKINHEGLDKFIEDEGYDDTFSQKLEVLKNILGNSNFVSKVIFSEEIMSDCCGYYKPDNHEIKIYRWPAGLYSGSSKENKYLGTLVHEAAHAMEFEKNLTLVDSIKLMIELKLSIDCHGYISDIGKKAVKFYAKRNQLELENLKSQVDNKQKKDFLSYAKHIFTNKEVDSLLLRDENKERFTLSSEYTEEWAEMVKDILTDKFAVRLNPEKYDIVNRYLKKYQCDCAYMRHHLSQ